MGQREADRRQESVMNLSPCLNELREEWLPHITDAGLERIIDLLEKSSPLLIHGAFTRAVPMGCLATQIAWNHPATSRWTTEAGIMWLSRVAGLNPATSKVIRAWDAGGTRDWELSTALLDAFRAERERRRTSQPLEMDEAREALTV
jgi:hypothetical protein